MKKIQITGGTPMIYKEFQGKQLSMLGFGAMRLPVDGNGTIDEEQVKRMAAYAMENGVNYFDTAYPYHGGESERVMGRVLSAYPRESWYLATKYPGHQILSTGYNPAEIFEEQLCKCGVEYFDFYLLHNVYEKSMETYLDPQWGIIDYFKEQKRLGRIRHLGFSTHAATPGLEKFLDACGDDMEFCQIQLNYLDWTLQDAASKYELLAKRGIPVWVMEPVRGGKLAAL
jgi:predicted aldo/keto reductase-like oxidoreductase